MDDFTMEGMQNQRFSEQSDMQEEEEDLFMKGFEDEDEVEECAECGRAIHENPIAKAIKGESLQFCTVECSDDHEESVL